MTPEDAAFVRELTALFDATLSDKAAELSLHQKHMHQYCLASAMRYVLQDILDGTEPIARYYYALDDLRAFYVAQRGAQGTEL